MARSIQEIFNKFNPVAFVRDNTKRILQDDGFFYGVLIVLVAVSSFGLGRLSIPIRTEGLDQSAGVFMRHAAVTPVRTASSTTPTSEFLYVASKNGTKYHAPWCPGAGQIKEENKVYFASKEEAEANGYTKASNCKEI